jgi:hypothetical protein
MKICNLGMTKASLPPQSQVGENGAASGDPATQAATADGKVYTPSKDLMRFTQVLGQHAEVRDDRVHAAIQRLRQGHYHTLAAAADTAAALLDALPLHT